MKKIKNYNLILTIFFVALNGCSSLKKELILTQNKGGYTVKVVKTNSKTNTNNLKITGKVFDLANGNTLSNAELHIGCYKIKTSSQGEYTFETTNFNNNLFYMEAIFIGYKTIQTDFINLTNKNEIHIDFFLSEDDRPLINCEGQ
jgi:hypothetical protein